MFITIHFIYPNKETKTIKAKLGANLMTEAHKFGINILAKCHYKVACSTCYVEFDEDYFNNTKNMDYQAINEMSEQEINVIDNKVVNNNYYGRLCCTLTVTKDMENQYISIPSTSMDNSVEN
ncbi:Rhodocoxin [bacterium AB1]|nr:Rhodocoxin [bacterium AB1]